MLTRQPMSETGVACSDEQRKKLVAEHVALIRFHASRLRVQLPAGAGIDELIDAGVLGLMQAVASYVPDNGLEFKSCADRHIEAAMVGRLGELNAGPCRIRSGAHKAGRTSPDPEAASMAEAKDLELCRALRINLDELPSFVFAARLDGTGIGSFSEISSNAGAQPESGRVLLAYHAARDSESAWVLDKGEILELLAAGVDALLPKERLVVSLHYLEELTMQEVATILRLPEWKVLQLHTTAMLRLRVRLVSCSNAHQSTNNGGN